MGGIDGGVRAGSEETIAAMEESILRVDQLPGQQLVEFTDTTRERENWKTEETYTTNCEEQILAQPNLYVATTTTDYSYTWISHQRQFRSLL